MSASEGIGRRRFMAMAGTSVALSALPAAAAAASRPPVIVNALGSFVDPNVPLPPAGTREAPRRALSPRVLADARASGLTAINVTLGYVSGDREPFEETIREIGVWEARLRGHPRELTKVLAAADILRAAGEGRIGIIYGFQNGAMMGSDASRAEIFADLGVRIIQLTYNGANQIGDGSMAQGNRGITPFGREVIAALNDSRIMVDLSHSGQRTCLEAAEISRRPISINHTGCRALTDLPRNKTDGELRAVASRGGFVGIYFMPFLNPRSVATPDDVVAHIDHAVNVCGEDHVGIGTDGGTTSVDDMPAFRASMHELIARRRAAGIGAAGENPDTLPFVEQLSGPDQFRDLIRRLEARRYPDARIEKIMGLNFVRYARDIWGG